MAKRTSADHVLEMTMTQVRSAMDRAGVNQTMLAKKIGRTKALVSIFLSGKNNLTLRTLVLIADALDCDVQVRLKKR